MRSSFKIIIISIAVIVVVALGYFIWKALSEPVVPPGTTNPTGTLPVAPTAPATKEYPAEIKGANGLTLRRISDAPIFDYWVLKNGEDVFYFTPDGKFRTVKDGQILIRPQRPFKP